MPYIKSTLGYIAFGLFVALFLAAMAVTDRQIGELRAEAAQAEAVMELARWQEEQTIRAFDSYMSELSRQESEAIQPCKPSAFPASDTGM